jgi:2-dehydropantoate 2-reductase
MRFQKILVLGAGAIGSSYGALLSRKNDVTLVGRKNHVEAINTKELEISGDIKERFSVKADTKIKRIPSDTLILLTTKAHDSAKALKEIEKLLKNNTVILILQNGLGNKELVKGIVGDKIEVQLGLVMMGAEFSGPGTVTFWNGETVLEQTETGKRIAELFSESGLKTRVSNKFESELWNKLVVNCVVNPLTAILGVRDNEIVVDALKEVRHGIIDECVKVGRAEGIVFEHDLKESVNKKILQYTNFSSMCQDLMKGKRTEIDFLNGKIVELGRKHHIPTPINETLVSLIKSLEAKQ